MMNRIQFIAIITLILYTANTLRLNEDHLAYDNTADYLQGLLNQQSQFQSQIAALKNDLNNTVNAASSTSDISNKISIL
jgi:peptidoglycan hydrolase CwlO-like protein